MTIFIPRNTSFWSAHRPSRAILFSVSCLGFFQANRALLLSCWVTWCHEYFVKWMPMLTMGRALFGMLFVMFFNCFKRFKVQWVNAMAHVASMMKDFRWRKEHFIDYGMRSFAFAFVGHPAVSVHEASGPEPASIGIYLDFILPSFWNHFCLCHRKEEYTS